MKSTKKSDLTIIRRIKKNKTVVPDEAIADLKTIEDLELKEKQIKLRIDAAKKRVAQVAVKQFKDKYVGKWVVLNGSTAYDTEDVSPDFDEYRIFKVKSAEPHAGGDFYLFYDKYILVERMDPDPGVQLLAFYFSEGSFTVHKEEAVKILSDEETLEILNMINIESSDRIGRFIQSVKSIDEISKER